MAATRKHGGYRKGSRSKTHKGRKDFTTKKGDKVFHRRGKYVRKSRKPYHKKRGGTAIIHRIHPHPLHPREA
jgi:hypothetical protein